MTDAQWKDIKDILKRIGVDADTVTVGTTPLRVKLERLAAWYAEHKDFKTPTPTQVNALIEEELKAIAAFRGRYHDSSMVFSLARHFGDHLTFKKGFKVDSTVDAMLQALEPIEAELRSNLRRDANRPAAEDNRDYYWYQLVHIWQQTILPLATKKTQKRMRIDFLVACTGDTRGAVDGFLKRLRGKAKRILADKYV
jgi:hypothetical protein